MISTSRAEILTEERRTLRAAAFIAIAIFIFVAALGKYSLPVLNASPLEAELLPPLPAAAKLYQPRAAKSQTVVHEKTVSTQVSTRPELAQAKPAPTEVQNQTVSGAPPQPLTRGPQVELAPAPMLPSALKNQNLKTSVLIEFFISSLGVVTPSLIGSSGNEEVDALALRAAQKWTFRPALRDGKPINAKVRLRLNFDVE